MTKQKNKNASPESSVNRRKTVSPSTVGLIVLLVTAGGIWGAVVFHNNKWTVNAPPEIVQEVGADRLAPTQKQSDIEPGTPATRLFYQYTERLEEQSAIVLSLSLALIHENLKFGHVPKDLPTLVNMTRTKRLWQPTWKLSANLDSVQTRTSIHYLRYRPVPVAVEVLTVSRQGDIQVTMMRLPEADGAPVKFDADDLPQGQAGAVILVSPQHDAPLPPPFTASARYEQLGWRREPFKLTLANEVRAAEIRNWVERTSDYLEKQESQSR